MAQDSDFKPKPPQGNKDNASLSETTSFQATTTHLKLVVSNPAPVEAASNASQPTASNAGFSVKVFSRGHNLYEMSIQDPFHEMECDLVLDIERHADETTVVCHFPTISDEQLKDFVEEDETLYGIIMIQFQMKILEQLLLFCATHYASKLIIYTDDAQAEALGVYQDFLAHKDQTLTANGEKTEMIIPADCETFDAWLDFMQETTIKFRQTLWQDQRTNPAIKQYLKTHPL